MKVYADTKAAIESLSVPEGFVAWANDTNELGTYNGATWDWIGGVVSTDHGGLSGLSDDDHPQYVKDAEFTAKGDLLGGTGSGTFAALGAGTDAYVLTADSSEATGLKWGAPGSSIGDHDHTGDTGDGGQLDHGAALTGLADDDHPQYVKDAEFTAKGDLLVGTGSGTFAKRAIGTNDYVLTADSAESDGVKWAVLPGGTGSFAGSVLGTDSQTGSGPHSLTVPGTISSGDLMLCYITTRNSTSTGPDAGSGWTNLLSVDEASSEMTYVWYRVSDGTETSVSVAFTGSENISGLIVISDGEFYDFSWQRNAKFPPPCEAANDQFIVQSFHGNYEASPWVMPTGGLGSTYTEALNDTSSNAEMMVAYRDALYSGCAAPLIATGGSVNYAVCTMLIVEPT